MAAKPRVMEVSTRSRHLGAGRCKLQAASGKLDARQSKVENGMGLTRAQVVVRLDIPRFTSTSTSLVPRCADTGTSQQLPFRPGVSVDVSLSCMTDGCSGIRFEQAHHH